MPNRKLPGELGKVRFSVKPNGTVLGRVTIRLGGGQNQRISATGATEDLAREAVEAKAREAWGYPEIELEPGSTIAELVSLWVRDLDDRVGDDLRPQSRDSYEAVVTNLILPEFGDVRIDAVTVAMADTFLRRVASERSASAAHKGRKVLSMLFDFAILHGAIAPGASPIQHVRRLPQVSPTYVELDDYQIALILSLVRRWGISDGSVRQNGPRPDATLLSDLILLTMGTSWRTAETLALRRSDLRFENGKIKALVGGTLVRSRSTGLIRQSSPKSPRQRRWTTLPSFAADVVRRRLAKYRDNPEALLFTTAKGRAYEQNNVGRLIRSFREANRAELEAAGIDVETLTLRAFRKDVATVVADVLGIDASAELLGHASTAVTEKHYARPLEPTVDVAVTEVLEARWGEIRHRLGP